MCAYIDVCLSHLVLRDAQVFAIFSDVLSNEDVVVVEQDVQQLIDALQTLLPHVRLTQTHSTVTMVTYTVWLLTGTCISGVKEERASEGEREYLHEGGQVGVVVVQRGDDVELDLHQDALPQGVLIRDGSQSMKQLYLGRSEEEETEEERRRGRCGERGGGEGGVGKEGGGGRVKDSWIEK